MKMAIVPLHMWLPDAHGEAPAPMSALLSGVIIGAGGYAVLRIALGTVYTAMMPTSNEFLLVTKLLWSIIRLLWIFTSLSRNRHQTDNRIFKYKSYGIRFVCIIPLSFYRGNHWKCTPSR